MEKISYPNPPIIEAICEFHFEPETEWDATAPGLIYREVEGDFPQKAQITNLSVLIDMQNTDLPPATDRMTIARFIREDGTALIQVGPNLLTINHLKPYISWDAYRPLIDQGLTAYSKVVSPDKIRGMALRYINRVEFNSPIIDLEDFFEFYPYVGPRLPQNYAGFVASIQISYEENRDYLNIKMVPAPDSNPERLAMLFELGYYLNKAGAVALDEIDSWIETAHTRLQEAFEASITDKLRSTFQ